MMCKMMDLEHLVIECDSQVVVHAIQQVHVTHWRLEY